MQTCFPSRPWYRSNRLRLAALPAPWALPATYLTLYDGYPRSGCRPVDRAWTHLRRVPCSFLGPAQWPPSTHGSYRRPTTCHDGWQPDESALRLLESAARQGAREMDRTKASDRRRSRTRRENEERRDAGQRRREWGQPPSPLCESPEPPPNSLRLGARPPRRAKPYSSSAAASVHRWESLRRTAIS